MRLINAIISIVVGLLDTLLPAIGFSSGFMSALDSGVALIVQLIGGVGYFLPLNISVVCFTATLVFDNWKLVMRVGQWVIELIRG